MTDTNDIDRLTGRTAVDPDGDKIGTIDDVYVDDVTGQPEWLGIRTGLFGTKLSFAPLRGAEQAGDDIVVPYAKSLVKDAPNVDADGHLEPQEEERLYAHYGRTDDYRTTAGTTDTTPQSGDDAMTRSEEQLDVHTRRTEAGRVRLRKWVETEDVHFSVPVQRETVRMVTEPITDENRAAAMDGPDIRENEYEVVLHEEVADVHKRVVPKEQVRLEKDVETDEVVIDDEVRKERIEMDRDDARRTR